MSGLSQPKNAEEELVRQIEVPILCRFWCEDEVWNGSAQDLPVSVFGKNFEQAKKHLAEALHSHFEALEEVGLLDQTIQELCRIAHNRTFQIEQMADNEMLWKTTAKLPDHRCAAMA